MPYGGKQKCTRSRMGETPSAPAVLWGHGNGPDPLWRKRKRTRPPCPDRFRAARNAKWAHSGRAPTKRREAACCARVPRGSPTRRREAACCARIPLSESAHSRQLRVSDLTNFILSRKCSAGQNKVGTDAAYYQDNSKTPQNLEPFCCISALTPPPPTFFSMLGNARAKLPAVRGFRVANRAKSAHSRQRTRNAAPQH